MTYIEQGENVRLDMTRDEFDQLLLMMGSVAGAALRQNDLQQFYKWLKFANLVNATNPNFTPYKIPEGVL